MLNIFSDYHKQETTVYVTRMFFVQFWDICRSIAWDFSPVDCLKKDVSDPKRRTTQKEGIWKSKIKARLFQILEIYMVSLMQKSPK